MTRFDRLSSSYDALLHDPIRDRFTGNESMFFHRRKADLIRRFFKRRSMPTSGLRYLDVGCGNGELLRLLQSDFKRSAGCDNSAGMLRQTAGIETRLQQNSLRIPFGDAKLDLVTAVCVYHHVAPGHRATLTADIGRVLRPGGVFCFSVWDRIEENDFAAVATDVLAELFPRDPPRFMARTPHGYHDKAAIARDVARAGFAARPRIATLPERSRAASPMDAAIAYCQGTPLRNEIEARDPGRLAEATDAMAEAIAVKFGRGAVDGKIQAHVVEVDA